MNQQHLRALLQKLNTLLEGDKPDQAVEALTLCARGLTAYPDHPVLLTLAGVFNARLGFSAEAENLFKRALRFNRLNLNAAFALGELLESQQRYNEAMDAYQEVLELRSEHIPAKLNLANCFQALNQFRSAERIYLQLVQETADPHLYRNLTLLALKENQLELAENYALTLLRELPRDPDAQSHLAEILLKGERFEEGWPYYEARLRNSRPNLPEFLLKIPQWGGQESQRLLVYTEEGVGDSVMFAMAIPELLVICSSVTLIVDRRLHAVFEKSFGRQLCLVDRSVNLHPNEFDFQIPIAGIMKFVRRSPSTFESSSAGFLRSEKAAIAIMRERLEREANGRKIIGLNWRSFSGETGATRSVPLLDLLEALPKGPVLPVNLQYGDVTKEVQEVRSLGFDLLELEAIDKTRDLDSLSVIISACDLIVSIDNSTAHLAGALGAHQALLLPFAANWRWGVSRQRSLLYANTHLLRQGVPGDWSGPLEALAQFD